MLDDLVEKALNGGYGELISGVILVLFSAVVYYVRRQVKRYDKVHDAVFGTPENEGLNSKVAVLQEQRIEDRDEVEVVKTELKDLGDKMDRNHAQAIDSNKTLTATFSKESVKSAESFGAVKKSIGEIAVMMKALIKSKDKE